MISVMNKKTISQSLCTEEQAINFTNENPFVTLTKCLVLFWSQIKMARRDEGLPVSLNIPRNIRGAKVNWLLKSEWIPSNSDTSIYMSILNYFLKINDHIMHTFFKTNDLLYLFFNNPLERNSIFICHCGMTPTHQKLWSTLLLYF